ncbi:hypothetical protein GMA11_03145 [Granulicatella sp. zg-ZJ]|uniref:hypothetical protein n=1 Tax=unclassified Granulicatella TaxID=2630493 RepID=UPI0013C09229|nr:MULTISPECIES: hypothetical protein [unclassified Granulicatella]NEW62383.1 hypothetical protein [Granulicatella sp. zg-ZJ]NEW66276.1 hypothetical protein [Granulicatella sp. zg-84]QMI85636.1 hypothetical protein H1220_08100 [Carnobacteriaceae bacterium zg-84]
MSKKFIGKFILLVSLFSVLSISPLKVYADYSINNNISELKKNGIENLSNEKINLLFEAVEKLDQKLIDSKNMDAIQKHFSKYGIDFNIKNQYNKYSFDNRSRDFFGDIWGVTKCVGAIIVIVGSTALGVGLLIKLKNFIAAAGGIQAAATAIMAIARTGFSQENIQRFGNSLIAAGSAILGIQQIQDNCTGK